MEHDGFDVIDVAAYGSGSAPSAFDSRERGEARRDLRGESAGRNHVTSPHGKTAKQMQNSAVEESKVRTKMEQPFRTSDGEGFPAKVDVEQGQNEESQHRETAREEHRRLKVLEFLVKRERRIEQRIPLEEHLKSPARPSELLTEVRIDGIRCQTRG